MGSFGYDNGNPAMFNLYIQDKQSGALRMVVPANLETGKQLAYAMFGCYVNTGNEDGAASYVFDKLPVGDYIVGGAGCELCLSGYGMDHDRGVCDGE